MFILRLSAYLLLIQISLSTQATGLIAEPIVPTDASIWIQMDSQSGLVISLPAVSPYELMEQLAKTQSELEAQKSDLTRIAQESKFTIEDGIITAVMPGGLVYAAYVSQRHLRAVTRLASVSRQLIELSEDLSKFRAANIESTLLASTQ